MISCAELLKVAKPCFGVILKNEYYPAADSVLLSHFSTREKAEIALGLYTGRRIPYVVAIVLLQAENGDVRYWGAS